MTSLLQMASAGVTEELEIEFPNLFDGLSINYFRGFEIFGIPIYWYGVIITLGAIIAYIYAHIRNKQFGIEKERMFDVVFAALIGGFIGARAYYCIFATLQGRYQYTFITAITEIRDGGLAIYGGIIGAFIVGFIMCKVRKVHIPAMFDLAALGLLIGQGIGRWGNFINQEAFGAVADESYLFGMTGSIISQYDFVEAGQLVHPCFLYESLWCLLGFVGLHFYSKKLRSYDGEIFLLYVAWYGLGRTFIEGMRTDSLMAGELRISQVIAAVSFVAALVLFIVFKILTEKKQKPLFVNSEEWAEMQEQYRLEEEARAAKKAAKKAEKEGVAESILADDADSTDDEENADTDEQEGSDENIEEDETAETADDNTENDESEE